MSIQLDCALEPVTALEFCSTNLGTLLLVGEGPYLKAFDINSWKLVAERKALDGQVIHGIAVREDVTRKSDLQVVVWGGKSSIADNAILVPDWVLDVAISPSEPKTCAAISAHNTLLLVDQDNSSKQASIQTLTPPLECILYSAHVIWESPDHLLVAAGTVFGDVVVWQCCVEDGCSSDVQLLFVFKGHEGSVFGVNISPAIIDHNGAVSRLVASCSDDRTIRVWDISQSSTFTGQSYTDTTSTPSLHPETGFKVSETDEHIANTDGRCIAVVMGHASRIWRVQFLLQPSLALDPPNISVFSFGEDSTTQQWRLEVGASQLSAVSKKYGHPASNFSARLSQQKTFAFHSGKSIWSAAMHQVTKTETIVVTGGADGKICAISIVVESPDKASSSEKSVDDGALIEQAAGSTGISSLERILDVQDVLNSIQHASRPNSSRQESTTEVCLQENNERQQQSLMSQITSAKGKKRPAEAFNRYAFVSQNRLLLTTIFGRILIGQLDDGVTWKEAFMPASGNHDLKSYAVLQGFPEIGLAFMAGVAGRIYAYRARSIITEVGMVGSKVADMFGFVDCMTGSFDLLVTTLSATKITLFHLSVPSTEPVAFSSTLTFEVPPRFVVTSASRIGSMLMLGSRSGSLAIYDFRKCRQPIGLWQPEDSIPGDAVTSFTILQNKNAGPNRGQFLTTARDGVYSIFTWELKTDSNGTTTAHIYPMHRGMPPLGPMIEAGWFLGSDFCLHGFRGKDFVVWNETQQLEIATVRCGGAHRSYAYCVPKLGDTAHFVYTKASKLYLHSQRGPSHTIVKKGGHGREIKACAVTGDGQLIATGAEDTTIRLWRYMEGIASSGYNFKHLAVLKSHVTGIQRLRWHGSKYLFSSGGNGEFFIWDVEDVPGFGLGVLQEAISPTQNEDRDLRVMDFDVTEYPGSSSVSSETTLLLSLAYSDSIIRTYSYSKAAGFVLLAFGKYTTASLMQISHIDATDGKHSFLTAATDGRLVLWEAAIPAYVELASKEFSVEEPAIVSVHQLHQSSIKALEWTFFGSNKYILVVTGGDDNALGISIYHMDGVIESYKKSKCSILRSAHAAAITGLCIASVKSNVDGRHEFRIVSSSNDQRLKEWKVKVDTRLDDHALGSRVEISMLGDVFTAVADVGDAAMIRQRGRESSAKVLVVGVGMEVLDVSCDDRYI